MSALTRPEWDDKLFAAYKAAHPGTTVSRGEIIAFFEDREGTPLITSWAAVVVALLGPRPEPEVPSWEGLSLGGRKLVVAANGYTVGLTVHPGTDGYSPLCRALSVKTAREMGEALVAAADHVEAQA
jgi:hypothetical protein